MNTTSRFEKLLLLPVTLLCFGRKVGHNNEEKSRLNYLKFDSTTIAVWSVGREPGTHRSRSVNPFSHCIISFDYLKRKLLPNRPPRPMMNEILIPLVSNNSRLMNRN